MIDDPLNWSPKKIPRRLTKGCPRAADGEHDFYHRGKGVGCRLCGKVISA